MIKPFVTFKEFRTYYASVTEYWLDKVVAENPQACCTMGEGANCRLLIDTEFFLDKLRAECQAHADKDKKGGEKNEL